MSDFVGRRSYMRILVTELDRVRQTGRGRFVSMRGRRRVGKSRLVDEFLRRGGRSPVSYVFFTASRQPLARELEMFAQDAAGRRHCTRGPPRRGRSSGRLKPPSELSSSLGAGVITPRPSLSRLFSSCLTYYRFCRMRLALVQDRRHERPRRLVVQAKAHQGQRLNYA
jgi:KaiC/GvpD/RAD55 family RecA-like ATPase